MNLSEIRWEDCEEENEKYLIADRIFFLACSRGCIEECERIFAKCERIFAESDFKNDINFSIGPFVFASVRGNVKMCEWLTNKFNLSTLNINPKTLKECFSKAAEAGNIDMTRFLYNTFGKIENMGSYLYLAFLNNKIDFVKFMFREGMVDRNDIGSMEECGSDIDQLARRDVDQFLKICEENSPIGSLTKAVEGYYV
jgi:hypothetical protein